jgi:hypothetical protein
MRPGPVWDPQATENAERRAASDDGARGDISASRDAGRCILTSRCYGIGSSNSAGETPASKCATRLRPTR